MVIKGGELTVSKTQGSKTRKVNKTLMITLEHFPELWQAALHFNGTSYSIIEYVNGIPQKSRRLKLQEASEYLQLAGETCKLSIEFLDTLFKKVKKNA